MGRAIDAIALEEALRELPGFAKSFGGRVCLQAIKEAPTVNAGREMFLRVPKEVVNAMKRTFTFEHIGKYGHKVALEDGEVGRYRTTEGYVRVLEVEE